MPFMCKGKVDADWSKTGRRRNSETREREEKRRTELRRVKQKMGGSGRPKETRMTWKDEDHRSSEGRGE